MWLGSYVSSHLISSYIYVAYGHILAGTIKTINHISTSQTPRNPTDALSQITLVKNRIARYQGNSLTPIFQIIAVLAKGTELLAHKITLLLAEVYTFRKANKVFSKRRRAKKTRVCQEGALTIEDSQDILAQKETEEQA
jgi:hypothetical protein